MSITAAVTTVTAAIMSGGAIGAAVTDGSGGYWRSQAFAEPRRFGAGDFAAAPGIFPVMEKVFRRMMRVMWTMMIMMAMKTMARSW